MNVKGQAAIVTGGASGLGGATASALAAAGAKVAIFDLQEELGEKKAKEIGGLYVKTNVADAANTEVSVKTVVEKLGIKPGLKVVVLGGFDAGFHRDVARALGAKPLVRAARGCDLVFVRFARPGDESRLAGLVSAIAPAGGVWAVYPKGQRELSEDTVRAAAKRAGLVDVKVVRFSDTLGALKLVIPKAKR